MATFNDELDNEDTFKILLATDIHLGYKENDPVRGNDSFETFEEVLKIAKREKVDFLLLGGDLFHVNKPSTNSYLKCVDILRRYCLGDKPCNLEYCSSPDERFCGAGEAPVNFLDKNMNISIPLFTIHGNHDDPLPLADQNLSALCILAATGLINYFGKSNGGDDIEVTPIILKKGNSVIALYGMGAIWNDILYRAFMNDKVKFAEHEQEFMNIFILHQNRAKHREKNFVKPEFIPDFFDLVFWGHEHDCRIEPEEVHIGFNSSYHVTQPGSTVATSLTKGESGNKYVGLLYVKGKDFKIIPIKLETVRPFILDDLSLQAKHINIQDEKMQINYIKNKVSDMLEDLTAKNPNSIKLPIVRLKVDTSGGYQSIPSRHFTEEFRTILANPTEVLLFKSIRSSTSGSRNARSMHLYDNSGDDSDILEEYSAIEENIVIENYKRHIEDRTRLCPSKHMGASIEAFVIKDQTTSISDFINYIQDRSNSILDSMIKNENLNDPESIDVIAMLKLELDRSLGDSETLDSMEVQEMQHQFGRTGVMASSSQQNTTYLSSMASPINLTNLDEDSDDVIIELPLTSLTQQTLFSNYDRGADSQRGNSNATRDRAKPAVKKQYPVKGKSGRGRGSTTKRVHSIEGIGIGSSSGTPLRGKRPRL